MEEWKSGRIQMPQRGKRKEEKHGPPLRCLVIVPRAEGFDLLLLLWRLPHGLGAATFVADGDPASVAQCAVLTDSLPALAPATCPIPRLLWSSHGPARSLCHCAVFSGVLLSVWENRSALPRFGSQIPTISLGGLSPFLPTCRVPSRPCPQLRLPPLRRPPPVSRINNYASSILYHSSDLVK
jgi:hypothetical protein